VKSYRLRSRGCVKTIGRHSITNDGDKGVLTLDGGAAAGHAALRCEGVSKRYGGVQALAGIDFAVEAGSVHALLGENGVARAR
jgi:ATPase subunit of ABC transporter with duplicated ATPase domains